MSTLTLQLDVRTCRHKLASYYGNTRTLMACSSASSCIRTAIYNTHLAAYQQKLALVSVSERSVGSNSRLAPAATTGQGEGYTTLAQPVQYEEEVKKSRFLVKAWPVQSGVEAQQRIKAASDPRCACVACIHSGSDTPCQTWAFCCCAIRHMHLLLLLYVFLYPHSKPTSGSPQ